MRRLQAAPVRGGGSRGAARPTDGISTSLAEANTDHGTPPPRRTLWSMMPP
eukprot:COSAG02_NODE_22975_length_733_cov_5.853312_2_plen_50_part_01